MASAVLCEMTGFSRRKVLSQAKRVQRAMLGLRAFLAVRNRVFPVGEGSL